VIIEPFTPPPPPGRWNLLLRTTAWFIDYSIYWLAVYWYARTFGTPNDEGGYSINGCGEFLVVISLWVVWFPATEAFAGRTLGKWICGLKVISTSGEQPRVDQAMVRRLLDPIDFFSFFGLVAVIVAKSNGLRQRLGDLLARTRVIEVPAKQ
jgi:uncharacterized RDD family membrane protein YckC